MDKVIFLATCFVLMINLLLQLAWAVLKIKQLLKER